MRKNNINLRVLFIILLSIVMINTQAQTGLNFQGVARTTNNVILASQSITIKLSILQGSATGTADYTETRKVTTNAQGLFTAVIGDTGAISTLGNFTTINWKSSPKFLKIEMDPAAGTNFITMGTTQFQYVAYAQFAKSVDAENIVGIVPVTLGGTGVNSLAGLKTGLSIDKINNTSDIDKPISNLTQTALDLKSNAADVATSLSLKLNKADTSTLSNRIDLKSNASDVTTSLALKANTSDVTTSLATKVDKVTGKELSSNDYTTAEKTKLAAITGTNTGDQTTVSGNAGTATKLSTPRNINGVAFDGSADINITATADAGTLTGTTLKSTVTGSSLTSVGTITSGVWSGTAVAVEKGGTGATTASAARTNLGLGNVENTSDANKPVSTATQTALDLKLNSTGNAATATKLSTPRNINGVAFDGSADINITATADAGTLTGTTLKSTVTGSSLTSVGTITSGVWSGTAVAVEKGGTGATTASAARTNLGLGNVENTSDANKPVSTATQTALDLKLNSTGNAATATKLSTPRNINGVAFDGSTDINITATADAGTLTGTTLKSTVTGSSLTSVGTITSGVWSGTAVAVEKGGTGATTASAARTNLGLGSVDNTSDANKPVSTATQTALDLKLNSAGNAATATKLAATKNINGVAFDGSGDITVTADAGTLTGTTLKSTVTGSSLTSVGTIASLSTGAITNSGKVIVGASSAASASAVLEASSTTQGFLPPRMSYYQKTQIALPIAGLTIWCSNCGASGEMQVFNGAAWTNMSGGTATGTISLSIGQSYQGGIVAYILQLGDPGYDANYQHGLIAATSDQSTGIQWYNGSYTTTGATGTAIGAGLSNTNTIIAIQGATSTSYAAGLARAYLGGGYTDWYLPSKDELNKLYLNRIAIGGFAGFYYWSSTENDTSLAWSRVFSNGNQNNNDKAITDYVRAIRAF